MLQLPGGLGLGLGLVLGFYSVRHLMNGWDLKYTFSFTNLHIHHFVSLDCL